MQRLELVYFARGTNLVYRKLVISWIQNIWFKLECSKFHGLVPGQCLNSTTSLNFFGPRQAWQKHEKTRKIAILGTFQDILGHIWYIWPHAEEAWVYISCWMGGVGGWGDGVKVGQKLEIQKLAKIGNIQRIYIRPPHKAKIETYRRALIFDTRIIWVDGTGDRINIFWSRTKKT